MEISIGVLIGVIICLGAQWWVKTFGDYWDGG
ncbi:hypothetical protein LCGC14_0812820 [marine sediment metagenome]|uniref:Uncharacterized protein n=1 Tax=marine sediment metagenome TaxID=412755 RepID=A0A0F9Q6B0_9ZZZZ